MGRIKYTFNGKDVSENGVTILSTEGIFDFPKRKIPYRHTWEEVSGEDVDLAVVALEPRIFKLDCIVSGSSISAALTNLNAFLAEIDTPGPKQFNIEYSNTGNPAPALSFLVFREEQVKVEKIFRLEKNVWRFTLTLQEYLPYKSIFRYESVANSDLSLQITTLSRPVILAAGNGTMLDVFEPNTYSVDYLVSGSYVIAIFSNHPSDFVVGTTNASFIWKL
ncbi:MAG: hypothetical protein K0B15_12275 [Lentimicrobium sp.]|nr:hypothetical protein [Lentimicrobium sp.]